MTGSRDLFTNISETNSKLHVKLGNNAECGVEGVGTIQFQLELGSPFEVTNVLYVPGMTKNLLAVSTMEDKGHEVYFRDGQVLVRPRASSLSSR